MKLSEIYEKKAQNLKRKKLLFYLQGEEIDAGQGTKIYDQIIASCCTPISVEELKEIKGAVKKPQC